jgi:putative transposase
MRVCRRLPGFNYVGRWRYFITCATYERAQSFKVDAMTLLVREALLRTAADYDFAIRAYCFMPDHLHLLVEGTTGRANLRLFMSAFRGRSARVAGVRLWQRGYYERVLRQHEPSERVIAYIIGNPVRARLVSNPSAFPYSWVEG